MSSFSAQTILVSSFHVLISRNILSPVLPILKEHGIRPVLIVPDYKAEFFRERFASEGARVEGVRSYEFSKSFAGLLFKRISRGLMDTETVDIRMRYKCYVEGKRLLYYGAVLPLRFLGRLPGFVRLARFLDRNLASRKGYFFPVFEKYKPDLVVSTDLNNENDVALLQDAARAGVPTLGIVRSWDNVTNYLIRAVPDHLIVGSETMREEIIAWHGIEGNRVSVCGIPHYDRYLAARPSLLREAFLEQFGLDPGRKTILYAPVADYRVRTNDVDPYVIGLLAKTKMNVIVRTPPAVVVSVDDQSFGPNVRFDHSGKTFFHKGDSEFTAEDEERLINDLFWCDVVVSGPGTMNIDASVFDKPIILINFYPTPRPFLEGIKEYGYTHVQPILSSGGVRIASSPDELYRLIDWYVEDPSRDREGRARIVREHAHLPDGHASNRVADAILRAVPNYGH